MLFLTTVVITSQSEVVVAMDGDESGPPTEIQNIDCPEPTHVMMNESLNSTDYSSCIQEDMTRLIQRTYWREIQDARGIANWLINEGESLQRSNLPIVPEIGYSLEEHGRDLLEKVPLWEKEVLGY